MTPDNAKQSNKKKGSLRLEAIIPVSVLVCLTFLYFSFYFDSHLKRGIEYVGTQVQGAEVNIGSLDTSFFSGSFKLTKLEITNPEKPSHNSLEIGSIHFSFLWDALLRMKFVVQNASIDDLKVSSPRKHPGYVVPPKPASPSRLEKIQDEIISQVKTKYSSNALGDLVSILEGASLEDKITEFRDELKSEKRLGEMIKEANEKKDQWNTKIKSITDTSKFNEAESLVNQLKSEKNLLKQTDGIKKLSQLISLLQKQVKEAEQSTQALNSDIKQVSSYPDELQNLINQDIQNLKNRFQIPQVDLKDLALNLFVGDYANMIVKARKYQALAEQYLPEKKQEDNEIIPPKRAEGKVYQFPITTGYPLFWLKRAAISSKGSPDTYEGNISGEITHVSTSPKIIGKPAILNIQGDFPKSQLLGMSLMVKADFSGTKNLYTTSFEVKSFPLHQKMFSESDKLRFGLKEAFGSSKISALLIEDEVKMSWNTSFIKPQFIIDSPQPLAKEILSNVVNNIPVISVSGKAEGTFNNLAFDLQSNLGSELASGFSRELDAKISSAKDKINKLIDERLQRPKEDLLKAIGANKLQMNQLQNLQAQYKSQEDRIKLELEKIKKGGLNNLKEQGKKIFKGIKF
jgi:uncharacterized protein (TIGR03545 family)